MNNYWVEYDAPSRVLKNIPEDQQKDFKEELDLWFDNFNYLSPYDEVDIRKELDLIDTKCPDPQETSLSILYQHYSSHIAHRRRLTYLKNLIEPYHAIFREARKSIEKQAYSIPQGKETQKAREAIAAKVVVPLVYGESATKLLLEYIDDMINTVMFVSFTMDRMIKEKEINTKLNPRSELQGQLSNFNASQDNADNENEPSIITANRFFRKKT